MKKNPIIGASILILLLSSCISAPETEVEVSLDVKHEVGGISQFDRSKYITIHSSLTENDWRGEDKELDYLINDLDVYMGRDNGALGLQINNSREDPDRPGFVREDYMVNTGRYMRETDWGELKWDKHEYDDNTDMIIGGQANPFWPGQMTQPYMDGRESYEIGGARAAGYFMGLYLNEFYRNPGEPVEMGERRPKWIEVINEPFWHVKPLFQVPAIEIFEYHNEVAAGIREVNKDVLIGGYTAAFPWFDKRNFDEWREYMKLFMDTCGETMDFYSLHFYDFDTITRNGNYEGSMNYRGTQIEATLDMVEQYSLQTQGEIKPFFISEYGGRGHQSEKEFWSPLKDWISMKAYNSIMLQFMDRPDVIIKAIPFITVKAEWGRDPMTGRPYNWRLLRQAFEKEGESGEAWVFTNLIKFYELWSEVKGTRIATDSSNPDVIVDSYVDGEKVFLILSNMDVEEETVAVNLPGIDKSLLDSVTVKHLYAGKDDVILEERNLATKTSFNFTLASEAAAIITFNLKESLTPGRTMVEDKFYSMTYLQPIEASAPLKFTIDEVDFSGEASAVLRIGFGRDHDLSKAPVVSLNGTALEVPLEFSGDDQMVREQFFGMFEIPVSGDLLQDSNTVEITFPDQGGHVSTVALKVFSIQ